MTTDILNDIEEMGRNAKAKNFDKCVKFVVEGNGSYIIDGQGGRPGDDRANVTVTTDLETFRGMNDGSVNAAIAYAQGKVRLEGNIMLAMQLERIFSA